MGILGWVGRVERKKSRWFDTAELDRIVKLMDLWMGGFKHFPKYDEEFIALEGFPLCWRNIIAMNTDK